MQLQTKIRREALMQAMLQDLQYAIRQLRKSPGFTFTAIVSLALGIGATTAVFSVIYGILVDPYPYANPDRMAHVQLRNSAGERNGFGVTAGQWLEMRKSPVIEGSFIADGWSLTVTGKDVPEDVEAGFFSSNSFNFFGVPAAYGRGLQPSDAIDGQDPQPVVVLSYKFWKRYYNGDPSVVGRTIQMVRKNYTIVGVAAQRFTWNDSDVYVPQKVTQDPVHTFDVEIRLKPGVTHAAANAALLPLLQRFQKETPSHFPVGAFKVEVQGLNDYFLEQLGGTLSLLFCAVALLLVIGCGNVSILLLARGTARQHEFAIRSAIGATRRRMIAQLITESLLLSLTGAALGVGFAYLSLAKIIAWLPDNAFPHEAAIHINVAVLGFSVAVAMLTGVLFGLWPALQLSKPEVSQVMQAGTRKVAGSVRGRRTLNALIGGQIALTLLMLAGAGAALEGFLKLMNTHLGYDPHNIMSVGIPVHENTFKTWPERSAYFEQLRIQVAAVPGVAIAGISSNATPPSNGNSTKFEIQGKPSTEERPGRLNFVSPEYFPALKVGLEQGRIWNSDENRNAAHVIVINQTFAKKYFPEGNPLGHFVTTPMTSAPPFNLLAPSLEGVGANQSLQVIGVIEDKRDDGLRRPILPEAFIPYTLTMRMWTQILVKTTVPPQSVLHAIQLQIASVNADQQVAGNPEDLEHWIMHEPEYQQGNLISWLFGSFAVLALALASVGLYSVVSYSVAQRTNEFGIRMALGAQRGHVLNIVFTSIFASVGGGVVAGMVLALAMNKVVAHWAEGSSRDPLMLVGATLVLGAVAAVACAIPARRASQVDPMEALRYE
jgi:putative ABC transport system permease protein